MPICEQPQTFHTPLYDWYNMSQITSLPEGSLLYREKAFATLSSTFSPWLACVSNKKSITKKTVTRITHHKIRLRYNTRGAHDSWETWVIHLNQALLSTCSMDFTRRSCVPPAEDWCWCSCNWLSSDPLSCSSSNECCKQWNHIAVFRDKRHLDLSLNNSHIVSVIADCMHIHCH